MKTYRNDEEKRGKKSTEFKLPMGDNIHPIVRWNVKNSAVFIPPTCDTIWKREDSIKNWWKENFNSRLFPNLFDRSVNVSFFFHTQKKLKKEEEEKDRPQCLTMDVSVKAQETFVFTSDERKCLDPYTQHTHTHIKRFY